MPTRPYLAKSIADLELLVAAHAGDMGVLDAIRFELGFRSTGRAARLHEEVERLLTILAGEHPDVSATRAHVSAP